jgi:diguanylate cyclase (GGDEF)-like protein
MKVLIADDEPVSLRRLTSSLSRWNYEVLVANDGVEASRILLSPDAPKLAILDWLMPGIDGVQLCRDIRGKKPEPYTYLILLTSKRAQDDVIRGLEAGADDYVRKPFDPGELKVRLRTGKRILYLQEHLISAREAMRDRAMRDELTGLWNRAAILNILEDELARSQRQSASLGVVLADLDHFKQVNDTHGHPMGDQILRSVAQTMRHAVRRYDSLGRYGGEEFVAILPGCDQSTAAGHAERLRAAVGRLSVDAPQGWICPTISLGVAVSDQHGSTAFDLVQAADNALYKAKRNGRNRVELAEGATLLSV